MCLTIQVRLVIEMKTIVAKADLENEELFRKASDILKSGGLVAFPTETVYGIGANALNDAACKNIFKAKGRAGDNPLIVHVNNVDMIKQLVEEPNEVEKILINTFCPGPFTLILKVCQSSIFILLFYFLYCIIITFFDACMLL